MARNFLSRSRTQARRCFARHDGETKSHCGRSPSGAILRVVAIAPKLGRDGRADVAGDTRSCLPGRLLNGRWWGPEGHRKYNEPLSLACGSAGLSGVCAQSQSIRNTVRHIRDVGASTGSSPGQRDYLEPPRSRPPFESSPNGHGFFNTVYSGSVQNQAESIDVQKPGAAEK